VALTQADVMGLLANPRNPSGKAKTAIVRGIDGKLREENMQGRASEYGAFSGKAGSIKRSRKGNTTRSLNGSRNYLAGGNWWDEQAPTVVAYRA